MIRGPSFALISEEEEYVVINVTPEHFLNMGTGESKELSKELHLFPVEDQSRLEATFTELAQGAKSIPRDRVETKVASILAIPGTERLGRRLCDLMTGQISGLHHVTYEGYVHCAALLAKGTVEDRANELVYLASGRKLYLTLGEAIEFLKCLLRIYFNLYSKERPISSWNMACPTTPTENSIDRLAQAMANDLAFEGHPTKDAVGVVPPLEVQYDRPAVSAWLLRCQQLAGIYAIISHRLFELSQPPTISPMIPQCKGIPAQVYPSWLGIADVLFVNGALPIDYRTEWRLLHSTRLHGESFSSLLGTIVDKGPSLIFLRDKEGYIFGGFASKSWIISPNFGGSDANFLFSLAPHMAIYPATGYNDHYQYLNVQQQTFPNGLGMGGQLEYFGIWLDAEYGKGHCSPTCTTYGNPQLSGSQNFEIDRMEVWAVGPEQQKDENEKDTHPSILDADYEAKAIIAMSGRHGPYSEGLRENPTADNPEEKQLPPLC